MGNRAERIKEYNLNNKGYNITAIKKMNKEQLQYAKIHGCKSLTQCYVNPSDTKIQTYQDILNTYNPEILQVLGGSHQYSVLLKADNGDILHITKSNNYLVEVI